MSFWERIFGKKKTKTPPIGTPGGASMRIALVSESKNAQITPDVVQAIAGACQRQLYEHFAPFWQRAGIDVISFTDVNNVPSDFSPLVVFDDSDQPGALGYHSVTPTGQPFGRVFVSPIVDNGGTMTSGSNSLSVTVSHEVLEAVVDPYVDLWADVDETWEDAFEACDRCEGDSYTIGSGAFADVALSNFLGPRAFRDGDGPYDWLGNLKTPFEVRPGGYCVRRQGGPGGTATQIFGAEHPEWKKAMRRSNTEGRSTLRATTNPEARAARREKGHRGWLRVGDR